KVHASWVNQVQEWNQEKVKNETIKNEICQFIQNAEQDETLANDALRQAKEISLNVSQETREAAWNDALASSKTTAQAWEKVVACFQAHEKSNIMQGNTYWVVLMNQAENQVIRWNAKSLWREANQLEVKVLESTMQAERFRKGTEENIKAWGEVLEPAKQLVEIMKEVESIYTKNIPKVLKELKEFKKEFIAEQNEAESYYNKCVDNRKNILEKKRESNFFKDAGGPIIEDAKASLAHAQELEKQADATYQKAQRGVGEGINLVWDDALIQIEKAERAYAQAVEFYENNINKIANASNASKIAWNKELEVAKGGEATCAAKLETSKVEKEKKMKALEEALLKAEQEQIANLHVEITRLLKEPTKKAAIAQEAYEKATKELGAVPLWEEAITKAQETAVAYAQTEQALLRGSQQAPSAQLQALWNQSLETVKNDDASWTNKAVTWAQEKDQSIDLKKIEERKAAKKKAAEDQIIKWKKQAEDALQKSAKAQTAGKADESEGWNNVHLNLLNAIEQKEKAIEAEVNEQSTIAQILKEAVQQSIKASEYYSKAIEACITGEKTNAEFFNNAGSDAKSSADYLKLASEVIEKTLCFKNNISEDEASLYQKLAEQYQLAAQYKQESAEQLILHRRDAANAFNSSISDAESRINCLKRTITIFEQAVNAEQMEHQSIVPLFHKLIQQHQLLDNLYQHLSDLCEQARKKKSTNDGRDSYYLAADFRFLDYTRECARISNDQTILAVKILDKVQEAENNQNQRASSLYQQQIEIYQSAAEYYREAGELHASRNETEANYFEEAGNFTEPSIEVLELAIETLKKAQEAEKNEKKEESFLCHKQVDVYQGAVEYYKKAAIATTEGNKTKSKNFEEAVKFTKPNIEILELRIETIKKAKEAEKEGNQDVESLYREQVKIYQNAAEYYYNAAEASTKGNETAAKYFEKAGSFAKPTGEVLKLAIEALKKTQEAKQNGNQDVESLYRKQVKAYQNATECYQKAAIATTEGNETAAKHFEEAINFTQPSIKCLDLAIEALKKAKKAEQNGNQDVESLYREQVKAYQNAAEYYHNAAIATIEGNKTAAKNFEEAINFTQPSIKCLDLAIEALKKAQEAGKNRFQEISSLYHKQVEVHQNA
ncbi:MAG TPA: hypothetical protein VJK54_08955, partial [Chthoniobacterales bacterium]|nr:hypothetical protein [Chthoniobacterales bacterium]